VRTVLITGAARRVGRAIALDLAARGDFVALHFNRSAGDAEAVAGEIRSGGGRCGIVQADLHDRAQVQDLLPRCHALFGRIDTLVNNASSYHFDTLATLNSNDWDENLRTNLEAPVFLTQAFQACDPGPNGAVVNMLDFKVANLNPDHFSYTVAKVALAGFTRLAAMAFRGAIRVNGVAPGLTLRSGRQNDEQFSRAWSMTPLGRGPTVDELTGAVRFALDMPALNGQTLYLDGGASLRPRARDISVDPAALQAAG
jgi:NAD(P)-dependent dehydrogenase (short-subunit alcohol dehydrogenase family)